MVWADNKKPPFTAGAFQCIFYLRLSGNVRFYFFTYITSFTSFTVLLTSGNASATRLGA